MPRKLEIGGQIMSTQYQAGEVLGFATLFDQKGFDYVTMGDHTLNTDPRSSAHNAAAMLSSMGALTRNVRLFTSVTDPYRRHPVEIAQWVATLDQLTGGRVSLGIGAGEMMNLAPFGLRWDRPLRRLREAVELIRLLWLAAPSAPFKYSGEIFSANTAYLQTRPIQKPSPPILIGALGPKTRALAGEIGDGWLPIASESPAYLGEHLRDVRQGASRAGRDPDALRTVVTIYTSISGDVERAFESVSGPAKTSFIFEREALKRGAGIEVPPDLSVQTLDPTDRSLSTGMSELSERIPRRMVEEVTAAGPPEVCIKRFEEYAAAGASAITTFFVGQDPSAQIETFTKSVLPHLRSL